MSSGKTNYEVRRQRGNNWETLRVFANEDEARKFADAAFADRTVAGVSIVQDWKRGDGMHIEKVIHTLTRSVTEKPMQVQGIEEVDMCVDVHDYYNFNSRMTIARLFKQYLDEQALTPTELLHNYREAKRLMDKDTLISAAVAQVSGLQAKDGAASALERKKSIFDALDALLKRAREVEKKDLPDLKKVEPKEAFAKVELLASEDEERAFLSRVMVTRSLGDARGFLGKLEVLLDLALADLPPGPVNLVDNVIADTLSNTAVVQEVLGNQPNLAGALIALLDLATGNVPEGMFRTDSLAGRLNQAFAAKGLEHARVVIFDWIRRQLKGTQPLNRRDPAGEKDAFFKVYKRLTQGEEWVGGPSMTEALTLRFGRTLPEGGLTGKRKAILGICELCETPTLKVAYLLTMLGSETGRELRAEILTQLREMITSKDAFRTFFGRNEGVTDKLRRVTKLYLAAGDVDIPAADKEEIRERLDDLLGRFVVEAKIIENMDDPSKSLRIRAVRLVQFCNSGALAPGRALKLAQSRMISHLRQPNFEETFVADLPDAATKAAAIKDFYAMLRKAGLA